MSIEEVSAEKRAELFHHYHQALAPDFACHSDHGPQPGNDVPAEQRGKNDRCGTALCLNLNPSTGNDRITGAISPNQVRPNGIASVELARQQ